MTNFGSPQKFEDCSSPVESYITARWLQGPGLTMEEQKAESSPPAAPPPKARGRGMWIGIAAVIVVVIIIIGLYAAGVFNPPPAPAATPLHIGAVLSMSGGLSAYGPDILKAIQMAISEINSQGGVLGQNVTLNYGDDATLPATGAQVATTLIQQNHVQAIIGSLASGVSASVISVCAQNNVVEVSPASTSPLFSNLTLTGGWFFRTVPSDALQGVVAAHYLYTNRSFRHVAVIAIDNPYGNGLASVFQTAFTALGGTVTQKVIVPQALTSYTTYLQTAFSSGNPDGVYFIAYPDTGLQLMKDWWANHASWPTNWTFSEGLQAQSFIDSLVSNSIPVQAIQGSAPVSPAGALYDAFASRFNTLYGHQPGLFASQGYDAAYMIALAAQKAGATDGASIKAQMIPISGTSAGVGTKVYPGAGNWTAARTAIAAGGAINYEGASGSLNWNQYGDPTSSYEIWGMNTSNQITELQFFPEAQVIAWTS